MIGFIVPYLIGNLTLSTAAATKPPPGECARLAAVPEAALPVEIRYYLDHFVFDQIHNLNLVVDLLRDGASPHLLDYKMEGDFDHGLARILEIVAEGALYRRILLGSLLAPWTEMITGNTPRLQGLIDQLEPLLRARGSPEDVFKQLRFARRELTAADAPAAR